MQFVIIAKRCSEFAKLHDYPCSCELLQLLTDGCTNPISMVAPCPREHHPSARGITKIYEKS